MRPASLLQFRSIALHPAIDRGVIDVQTPLPHHLFEIAVAERISKVPAYTEQNDVGFVMTPFERVLLVHEGNSSSASIQEAELTTSPPFLQQNRIMIPQPIIIAHMLVMESTSSMSSLGLSWRRPATERPSSCASPAPKTTPGNEPLRCSVAGTAIANPTLITPKMRKKITQAPSQLLQRKVVSIACLQSQLAGR